MPPADLIEFRNISKKFGSSYANRDISLRIAKGEIHAIVGENGAGKTTLMNVLFGRFQPDSGSLILKGVPVLFSSPREAVRAGIGMVHQDILFFPQLSVLENIIVGHETGWPRFFPAITRNGPAREKINRIQESLGFHLELDLPAKELSFALRQQIEIVRMLYRGVEILILDEPSSLLSPDETWKLLDLMKSLRAGGRTIIFISHRLVEIFSVADRITVLRKGALEATLDTGTTDAEEIARLMVGSQGMALRERRARDNSGRPRRSLLEIRNLRVGPRGSEPALRDISLSIPEGVIFGVGGVVCNGQRSLARVLAGKTCPDSGSIRFGGAEISRTDIKERLAKLIRWLPENPVEESLLPERPLWENLLLGRQREEMFAVSGIIRKRKVIRFSEEQINLNNIASPGVLEPVSGLSGGNRQKVALCKVLEGPPRLAILEQPCRATSVQPGPFTIASLNLAGTKASPSS